MAKVDFERTPDGYQRILDGNLKVEKALFIPVFTGAPDLNNNTDEAGAIALSSALQLIFYDGTTWRLSFDMRAYIQAAPTYDDEAAATTAGLSPYTFYKTSTGELRYKLPGVGGMGLPYTLPFTL